jgi:hypothetical protein
MENTMLLSGSKSSGSEIVASPKLSASLPSKLPSNQTELHTKQNKQQALSNGGLKKCLYCGSKSTPMWRRGPQGAGTLCNACGVKWKHGKILCGTTNEGHAATNDDHTAVGGHTGKERKGSKADKKRKKAEASAAKKEKRPKVKNRKGKKVKTAMEEDPNAFTHGMELDADDESNVDPIDDTTPKGDAYIYEDEEDDDDGSTLAGQDHMDIQTAVKAEPVFAIPFARSNTVDSTRHVSSQFSHGHPSHLLPPGRSTWDTVYSSSSSSSISTSELFSPRESYASSPTSSPSSILMDVNHHSDRKNPSNGLMDAFTLAQSAADDAVEAATVLTMLRSS